MKRKEEMMQPLEEDELEDVSGGVSEVKYATCKICCKSFSYRAATAPEYCGYCGSLMNYLENFVKTPDLGI